MGIKENVPCDCKAEQKKGDNVFSPLKKMKVLKKIKRRMGLASRSSSTAVDIGTNNLTPLLFHNVHGENVRISRDGRFARRVESFCKGVVFSSRPVIINEKVCMKFLEISNNWSGVIRFGFTYNDPHGLRHGVPKYACPDLTNKPGYWAKALPERYCCRGTVLSYYVTAAGDVHFGINGEEKGVFFSGVDMRGPLWCLIDIYGNSTALELVDVRHQLNNSADAVAVRRPTETFVESIVCPMQQLAIRPPPPPRHQPPQLAFRPLPLHRTKGRNVRIIGDDRCQAVRPAAEFCQGYVFTGRPLRRGERVVVQVLGTEPMFQGCLGIGLTSCDPATLRPADLPDDSNCLLDRPEYWVLSRDFGRHLLDGDEVSFCVSAAGEVRISRNGGPPLVVIHVDHSLRLWAFLDVYGSTRQVRVLSAEPEGRGGCRVAAADVQVQPSADGGAVLSVVLPPAHAGIVAAAAAPPQGSAGGQLAAYAGRSAPVPPSGGGALGSACSGNYVEPISDSSSYSTPLSWAEQNGAMVGAGAECTICYENPIDAVLYMCGHMCMCYECALQQWRGKGGGHCPLCRAVIRDVIRTYKS